MLTPDTAHDSFHVSVGAADGEAPFRAWYIGMHVMPEWVRVWEGELQPGENILGLKYREPGAKLFAVFLKK